jgi:anti-sigma factor RsiW
MNCRAIEPLLLAERDGVLTPEQHAALAQHVAACPACRQERLIYGEAVTFLKTDAANIPVPDIDREWRAVRAQLSNPAKPAKKPLAPVIWFGAPLAAAAALAVALFVSRPVAPTAAPEEAADATIAYVDSDSGWLVVWAADAKTSG